MGVNDRIESLKNEITETEKLIREKNEIVTKKEEEISDAKSLNEDSRKREEISKHLEEIRFLESLLNLLEADLRDAELNKNISSVMRKTISSSGDFLETYDIDGEILKLQDIKKEYFLKYKNLQVACNKLEKSLQEKNDEYNKLQNEYERKSASTDLGLDGLSRIFDELNKKSSEKFEIKDKLLEIRYDLSQLEEYIKRNEKDLEVIQEFKLYKERHPGRIAKFAAEEEIKQFSKYLDLFIEIFDKKKKMIKSDEYMDNLELYLNFFANNNEVQSDSVLFKNLMCDYESETFLEDFKKYYDSYVKFFIENNTIIDVPSILSETEDALQTEKKDNYNYVIKSIKRDYLIWQQRYYHLDSNSEYRKKVVKIFNTLLSRDSFDKLYSYLNVLMPWIEKENIFSSQSLEIIESGQNIGIKQKIDQLNKEELNKQREERTIENKNLGY